MIWPTTSSDVNAIRRPKTQRFSACLSGFLAITIAVPVAYGLVLGQGAPASAQLVRPDPQRAQAAPPGYATERDAAQLYAQARELMDRNKPADAVRLLDQLIARYPTAAITALANKDRARLSAPVEQAAPAAPAPERSASAAGDDSLAASQAARLAHELRSIAGDRIFFASGGFDIGGRARAALEAQAVWLIAHPAVVAVVEGHADDPGTPQFNADVAAKRAEVVRQRLIDLGVPEPRVRAVSIGREQPVARCADPACGAQNRRAVTTLRLDKAASLREQSGAGHEVAPPPNFASVVRVDRAISDRR